MLSHESEYKMLNHLVGMHCLYKYTKYHIHFVIESLTLYTIRMVYKYWIMCQSMQRHEDHHTKTILKGKDFYTQFSLTESEKFFFYE